MHPVGPDPSAVREELRRVLTSPGFAQNERLSRFLRFVVERQLEDRGDEIKESVIGVEVFNRRADFDPKQDSIVRTEAARLRSRLTEYYAGEGRDDAIVIDVPKGGYVPLFHQAKARRGSHTDSWRRWLPMALACTTVVLIAAGWSLRQRTRPIRIAVLPLENLSRDASNDYFADGLTDEIIRNLSVIDGLEVRSQTSSFAFKGRLRNVREAGQQLDAEYLVEGSVLREGDQLRINAQLIRARDDVPQWSDRFDRTLTDVFAIQDEISRGIVNNLRLQLGRGRRRYETSVEAYDLYLRARALSLNRSFPGVIQSIGGFEQAIAKDPSFAPAYAALGAAYAIRSTQFPLAHAPDELEKMRSAAEKAIQLDPLLSDAYEALALANARDSQWGEAESGFRKAIELDPNRSGTRTDFAVWLLAVLGRNEEALQQLHVAERADPLSSDVQQALASTLIALGRYDDAAPHCLRMSADDSLKIQCIGRARLGQGRIGEAVELFAHDPALSNNPQTRGFLGYVYARSSHQEEAETMAARSDYANEQALIYAGLRDTTRTLDALQRMSAVGAQRIGRYLNSPELAWLRGDSRLEALRRRMRLPG